MKHFALLISVCVLLSLIAIQVYAVEVVFDAFSGEKPIPNENVQDPEEWAKNSVTPGANTFSVANDRLVQTANECAMSTKTLLPVVDGGNWVNYTVSVDVWYKDDDAVGIIFRYTDEESFYSFVIAGSDTNYNDQWYLGNACAAEGVCFFDSPRFDEPLANGPNNPVLAQNTPYTMMARVAGPKIEVFFGPQVPRADILQGVTPPRLAEVTDNKYARGKVGIFTASCPVEFANILVISGPGTVDTEGKLAVTWAGIKKQ